jgi:hypothetical protein
MEQADELVGSVDVGSVQRWKMEQRAMRKTVAVDFVGFALGG